MAKLQKFLFDQDFGSPSRPTLDVHLTDGLGPDDMAPPEDMVEEEPPPPPPPTFSEEELQLARDQAFEAGRSAGISEAEAMTERLLALAQQSLGDALLRIAGAQEEANDRLVREAVAVAVEVVRKLYPEMTRHHGLDELEALLHECLSHLDRDMRVTVRIAPELLETVRTRADKVAVEVAFEGKLLFAADARIAPGDIRVDWGDGGAERDLERSWREIDAVLARALGTDGQTEDNQAGDGFAA